MYFVYIVRCSDDTLYTGFTTDLERRINEHNNSKKGARYTSCRRPVRLEYFEGFKDKSSACKREWEIKKLSRENKIKLINTIDFR